MRSIREGEVWWFADGQNVGVEINGKGERFARPILILTKFGKLSFTGIPLTSKRHNGSWYVEFTFKEKTSYAVLCQAKMCSVYRLYRKMGVLPEQDFNKIGIAFLKLHAKKFPQSCDRGRAGIPEDTSIIARLIRKIKRIIEKRLAGRKGLW